MIKFGVLLALSFNSLDLQPSSKQKEKYLSTFQCVNFLFNLLHIENERKRARFIYGLFIMKFLDLPHSLKIVISDNTCVAETQKQEFFGDYSPLIL